MTLVAAASNEPMWLRIARENPAKYEDGKLIPDAEIRPPGEATSAFFVADCLNAARRQGVNIPSPGDTIGELSMYGSSVDPQRIPVRIGMIVLINQPQTWIPAVKDSAASKLPNTAKSHVGFLVRKTLSQVYVLGEGAIRAFPLRAVGSWREVPVTT